MKPVDIIAIMLTLAVLLSVMAPAVRGLMGGAPITDKGAHYISEILKVVVGAIVVYMGHKMGR